MLKDISSSSLSNLDRGTVQKPSTTLEQLITVRYASGPTLKGGVAAG
jgi:hypothetical protein